jgi:protein TonB
MHTYEGSPLFSRRKGTTFTAVMLLHFGFGFALYSELAGPLVKKLNPPPLNLVRVPETIKEPIKPPLTAPLIDRTRLYVTPPELPPLAREPDVNAVIATPVPPQAIPSAPPQPGTSISIRMDPKHPLRIGEAYYPDASRRANEMGRCVVQVTVAIDGRIVAAILQSSTGFDRLDQACINGVRGQRMLPAIENGRPIESTASIPISWHLSEK